MAGGTAWAMVIATAGLIVGASYRALISDLGTAGDVLVAIAVVLAIVWWRRSHRRAKTST